MDALRTALFWGLVALAVGSAIRFALLGRIQDRSVARERLASLASWWLVALCIGGAALLGRDVAVLLFAGVSGLAFRELLRLVPGETSWWDAAAGLLLLAGHYALVWLGLRVGMEAFLPLGGLVWASGRVAVGWKGPPSLAAAGQLYLGLLLTGWGLSHAVWFFVTGIPTNPVAGPGGWFLFLLVLVEANDIVQALVGRRFGRHFLAPELSPFKTWEGLLAGVVTTLVLAPSIASVLTPLTPLRALVLGALVAPAGVAGDLTISAFKRRAGVKDSGRALPGQGGILDRVDSLLLSAPLFFWFVVLTG